MNSRAIGGNSVAAGFPVIGRSVGSNKLGQRKENGWSGAVDKRDSLRHLRGNSAAVSERTSDLLHDQPASATKAPRRPVSKAAGTKGGDAGPDPDPTVEILASTSKARTKNTTSAVPVTRHRAKPMEVTQPVGCDDVSRDTSWKIAPAPAHTLPVLTGAADSEETLREVSDARLPHGRRVADRYVILDEVDDSGMGLVYKAFDRQRERAGSAAPWVALKTARPGTGGSDTAANLRQEFLKLSALRHPNIVAVYDLGSDDGMDFMVLEWLRGETLADVLAGMSSKRIALRTAQEVIRSIAEALAHAHDAGVVHGDVKPSNIFMTRDQGVKLLDFGASVKPSRDVVDDSSERSWATRAYASCDVLEGKQPRPSDDVFALGVTGYLLLSGERPFGDLDAATARDQNAVAAKLPDDAFEYWPAIRSALEFDALDRPADAQAFLQLLDEDAGEPPTTGFPRHIPVHVTAIAWGALAAIIFGLTVWWSIPDFSSAPTRVEQLLEDAKTAEAGGRLVAPPENNAAANYSAILTLQPENGVAKEGLDRIVEEYLTRARTSLSAENYDDAVADLEIAKRINPGHFGIAAIEDLIARFRRDLLVRAQEAADTDLDVADRYLAQATSLSDADDADLARAREEVRQKRTAAEIEVLISGVDERILAERLTVPAGDSAVDLLRQAMNLAPENRQVQLAQDRIVSALLFQAMFSISNGKLNDAGAYIDAAKSLHVRHLALARAEYELAKARNEAVARGNEST